MQIIEKKTAEIKPYENNPRKNKQAVDAVANSIREFGFKVPIVIDRNNVIVAGHTRLKAAKRLGIKTVPCIIADDLTEEQVKAFRLADNKVSELAGWDYDLLGDELDGIFNIDMLDFGFSDSDFDSEEDPGKEDPPNEPTIYQYNLDDYDESRTAGWYQMPTLEPVDVCPNELIGFSEANVETRRDGIGVHFFIDDYKFHRIWQRPHFYIEKLIDYECCCTPDFSLYMDMPMAMKVWNVYRSRLIGQIMQDAGILVVPTLQWAEPETYDFCFDGIPKGSTVATSTEGVKRDEDAMKIWIDGMTEAMKRLEPKRILVCGDPIDFDYGNAEVKHYGNSLRERLYRHKERNDGQQRKEQ